MKDIYLNIFQRVTKICLLRCVREKKQLRKLFYYTKKLRAVFLWDSLNRNGNYKLTTSAVENLKERSIYQILLIAYSKLALSLQWREGLYKIHCWLGVLFLLCYTFWLCIEIVNHDILYLAVYFVFCKLLIVN